MGTVIRPQSNGEDDNRRGPALDESFIYADTIHQPLNGSLILAEEPGEREKEYSPTLTSGIFQQVSFSRFPRVVKPALRFKPLPETRRKLVVGFSGILIGALLVIAIGMLAAQYKSVDSDQVVLEPEVPAVVEPVSNVIAVVVPPISESVESSSIESSAIAAPEVDKGPVQQIIPSDIENYARNSTPVIEARTFLATPLNSARRLEPGLAAPAPATVPLSVDGADRVLLRPVEGEAGRFFNQRDGTTWQGGWRSNDPQHNIQLGTAYSGYVSGQAGASSSSLRSFDRQSNDLVRGSAARGNTQSGPRNY